MNSGQMRGGKGDFGRDRQGFGANPANVVSSSLGIISVFAIVAYYLEKLLMLAKSKKKIGIVNNQ